MGKKSLYCISTDTDVKKFLDNLDFKEHSESVHSSNFSGGVRPNDIAEKLFGFKADFTEQPPFCFIKTNTRIWELFLLRNSSKNISSDTYLQLTQSFKGKYDSFDNCTCAKIGIKKSNWCDTYTEIKNEELSQIAEDFFAAAKEFTNHFSARNRIDSGKLIPLRAKNIATKVKSQQKDKCIRSKAAKAFFRYMIGDKNFSLTQEDVERLEKMKNEEGRLEENQLIYLLEKRPNRHVFFVGLMLCLFGRSYTNESEKKRVIGVSANFAQKIALLLPKFADNQEYAYSIQNDIMLKLKSTKKNDIHPIYREKVDQKYRVSFRLNTWIHLLIESKKAF